MKVFAATSYRVVQKRVFLASILSCGRPGSIRKVPGVPGVPGVPCVPGVPGVPGVPDVPDVPN
eukprot:2442521-Amphidinium_carterae.1